MMEVEHADDASKFGSSSMASCLPLLVFHHHPNNHGQKEDKDNEEDEMLMFSISKQSLHTNMKRGFLDLAAGGGNNSSSSMCWATPQGWMLLITQQGHDDDDDAAAVFSAYLWNPLTGDKLSLPDIKEEENRFPQTCKCLLSYDPTRPGCVVVLFHPSKPDLWYCQAIIDDDEKTSSTWRWRHYSYDIGDYKLPAAYCPPKKMVICTVAAFQGRLYFINSITDMCAIDFASISRSEDPEFHYFDARKVDFPAGMNIGATWLLDFDDQIFLVDVSYVGFDPHNIGAIRVYKMDFSSSSSSSSSSTTPPSKTPPPCWRRVSDIGDTVFLLDDTGLAASCPASLHGLKRNQVYFMKNRVEDDADMCVFNLESECREITRVHHHDGLLLRRKPFWIVPPS